MLRNLRSPGDGGEDDLGRALRRITGTSSVRDAVLAVSERALRNYPRVYWTAVRRIDLEGERPDDVAREVHLSRRSFFRYRSAAVAAIAGEVANLVRDAVPAKHGDISALAQYARGRYLLGKRTPSALAAARVAFDAAIRIDPSFAAAYAGVADVALQQGAYLLVDRAPAFRFAYAAVQRALALDPTSAEAHTTRGDLFLFERHDRRRARMSYERALTLAPNHAAAHQFAAWYALFDGDVEGAVGHLRTAVSRNPASLELQTMLGLVEHLLYGDGRSVEQLESIVRLDPEFTFARFELVRVLASRRRYADAREHLAVLLCGETRAAYVAADAHVAAGLGDARAAERLVRTNAASGGPHYLRAIVHAGLDDAEATIGALRAAAAVREPWIVALRLEGFFWKFHGDRRFQSLLEEIDERVSGR